MIFYGIQSNNYISREYIYWNENNMFNIVLIRKMMISCSCGIVKIYIKELNEKCCERMLNLKVEATVISDNGIHFSD